MYRDKKKENLVFLLILLKKAISLKDGANISLNELLDYANFVLRNKKVSKEELIHSLINAKTKDIVDYL
jgi:hypothetical protein